jgi:hypothetical protein
MILIFAIILNSLTHAQSWRAEGMFKRNADPAAL